MNTHRQLVDDRHDADELGFAVIAVALWAGILVVFLTVLGA